MKIDSDKLYSQMANKGIFTREMCSLSRLHERQWLLITEGNDALHEDVARIAAVLGVPMAEILEDGGNVVTKC